MPHGIIVSSTHSNHKRQKIKWSMTVMMNARDLSRDDDFLSHLLVEHLGTAESPLQVHKMDPTRRLPEHDPVQIMDIVKKYIVRKGGLSTTAYRIKRAVDGLLQVPAVKSYLHRRSSAQINAFATHASRYFELYLPTGSIEISHTSRYSHRTGKSELCILATSSIKVGQVITDLKGSLAHLTAEEDEELKRTDVRGGVSGGGRGAVGGIRRDFSVIHSNQKNKSHLFLGPARFVNHDCDHNVELFRDGRVITFRVIKAIAAGQEVTAHYGEGYFGKGNRHCLCQTCEKHSRGGYAPTPPEGEGNDSDMEHEDDSSTDEETREERIKTGLGLTAKGNPNERRTRRGVYAILAEGESDDEDSGKGKNVTGASSVNSGTATPTVNSGTITPAAGNASLVRRLSDASSSLTSLSDYEKNTNAPTSATATISATASQTTTKIISITLRNGVQTYSRTQTHSPSAPLSRLSSISSLSSPGPIPPTSALEDSCVSTPTRMNTRSSAANITTTGHTSTSLTPRTKVISASTLEKRTTRSSSHNHSQIEPHKKDKSTPAEKDKDSKAKTRGDTGTASPSPTKHLEGKRSAWGIAQSLLQSKSKSKSKSSTPAAANVADTAAVKKPQSLVPRCGTCANEVPGLVAAGVQTAKGVVHSCARCKRHLAIFGSPWPDRLGNLEPMSESSSESSSNDIEYPHSPRKDKHGKIRIIDSSHKRRKTDPVFYIPGLHAHPHSQHQTHHTEIQPRSSNGQFGRFSSKTNRHFKKFAAVSGLASESRSVSTASVKLGKRKWDGSLLRDDEDDDDNDEPGLRKTIRRLGSLPILPGLCARPSPIVFAKSAWTISPFVNTDGINDYAQSQADEDPSLGDDNGEEIRPERPGLKSLRSISRNVSGPVPMTASVSAPSNLNPNSASGSGPAPGSGSGVSTRSTSNPASVASLAFNLKRKREPIIPEPVKAKQKPGRTFYRKDEKKPMPKGWVIITDSSEETGEEEEREEGSTSVNQTVAADADNHTPKTQPAISNISKTQVEDYLTSSTGLGSASVTASTPSLVHTPSSRADSTPAQSVETPPEDQVNTSPAAAKTPKPSEKKAVDAAKTISPSLLTPKRQKINDMADDTTRWTRSRGKQVSSSVEVREVVPPPIAREVESTSAMLNRLEPPINVSGTDSGSEETAVRDLLVKPEKWDITTTKSTQAAVTFPQTRDSESLLEKFTGLHILTPEQKHAALEVSNLIHGTAFSYGHPDARTSWKPKYQYSEIDGWNWDTETFL